MDYFRTGPVSEAIKDQLYTDFLRFMRPGIPQMLVLTGLYHYIVINQTDDNLTGVWFGFMYTSIVLGTLFAVFWEKHFHDRRTRVTIIFALSFFVFGTFGASLPYYYVQLESGYVTLLVIIVAGVVGALSGLSSNYRSYFLIMSTALIGPETVYFALQDNFALRFLALLIPFYIIVMTVFVASDYVRRVAFIQANHKLDAMHSELADNHSRLQALKKRQDGDYFLMSLLVEPLGRNKHESDNLKIEFFSRGYKRFSFRKWRKEIGGDMNIADNLMLGDRRYTVFLNADAMGKSMQGAGGILVLGSVFQSILVRSQTKKPDMHPEHWLKDALDELQGVFYRFDGSMLVSLVVGLIDESTGLLYYVNAEHPFSILIRDGKAGFLEQYVGLQKIGIDTGRKNVPVFVERLQTGDVLYFGSDGRDDLIVGTGANPEIDNDENRFPRIVEGLPVDVPLKKVYRSLLNHGKLSDDLSLIRITVRGINALSDAGIGDLMNQYKEYKQKNAFAEAAAVAEKIADHYPEEPEYLYKASACYWNCGNKQKALDWAYRYFRRNPNNGKAIQMLAKLYQLLGDTKMQAKFAAIGRRNAPKRTDWDRFDPAKS